VVPRSSRIGSAQTTGSGIRYLIAIDICAFMKVGQLAISEDLARIEARYWLLLLGSGCVVGKPYLTP
jgi:hypothetical protein